MYSFGSGVLLGTRTDIANATPVNFGLVQEVTIEESATVKEIYGQYQYPLVAARGTVKTTGKAKVARISGLAFANLFWHYTFFRAVCDRFCRIRVSAIGIALYSHRHEFSDLCR